ncbi:hypothetical protein L226DRAFT_485046 [Lentinus tigrinus ALCF2SS1-7]|uniref:Uncharacterized protein n=1 Tax=Lentinus tigrinus ALCF2SS1-6 TaxID=1328759 RepID=A0A5C2SEQ6_9APHY|nr:hypothetical protein L227DRAFT_499890 [Lentinus tigrinus ALCF2SS1-6]RPD75983.1 hypothetical protein L226DRAFT_485046 [Lentinus tigrinus ALCF2SS1-7]
MDQKRAKTLEALEKFMQSQKDVLVRTNADIEQLKALRKDVVVDPPRSLEGLNKKLNDQAFRLSNQTDIMPRLPKDIDWSVFNGLDPTPFRTMATNLRNTHAARNTPPHKSLTAPCSLRQLVASTRASVVDPVLSTFRLPDDLAALSSDDEPDPEELRRAREREKIRELKKRRIVGDSGAVAFAGLGLRTSVAGVFIRRDQEDESAEVDISMGEDGSTSAAGSEPVPMAVDTPATSIASPASVAPAPQHTARERRTTRKARVDPKAGARSNTTKATPKTKAQTKVKAEQDDEVDATPAGPSCGKDGKPKSETYKQAWSVSEQHLLERLLEEIPEGEKNRWAKISKAMNGRRTARQVASRVQKYYEKLKRFGVEVGGSKAGASG